MEKTKEDRMSPGNHVCECGGMMHRVFAGNFRFGFVVRCYNCGLIYKIIKPKVPEKQSEFALK